MRLREREVLEVPTSGGSVTGAGPAGSRIGGAKADGRGEVGGMMPWRYDAATGGACPSASAFASIAVTHWGVATGAADRLSRA